MAEETILDKHKKNILHSVGKGYTLSIDTQIINLGKSKENAIKALQDLEESGIFEEKDTDNQDQSGTQLTTLENPNKKNDPDEQAINNDDDDYSDILGQIVDIKPSNNQELTVLYKGIDIRESSHPVIKSLPIVFRWRARGNNNASMIDDGSGNLTISSWQVLMRDRHAKLFNNLTLKKNETPKEQFVQVGDLILCISKKEDYEKQQREKSLSGLITAKKDKERRTEIGQNVAKIDDVEKAEALLTNTNAADVATSDNYEKQIASLKDQL